ncbi:MAG: hypothetical protein HON98_11590 [Chloroflexi bacterium]|jgi:hypothetical protein|nr:hypothetical protein [Chloroflexota bacterium]MBT3670761.1 hypothetical protein [Chloroflexota bacterium]MBT4004134.1 hypothetical protein [Chloroflexota bacterium]MBT4305129.1 hypothetical protein [Chloroflexota bacterium]MBT4533349.1 hypothetical protein [Chloroflexota bacterium]
MDPKRKVIYLDQNKWIDLARAFHKRPDGEKFLEIFDKLRNGVEKKEIILPLDFSRFTETRKISNNGRRRRLATVMGNLSKAWTLAPQEKIINLEIRSALTQIYGELPSIDF